MFFRGMFFQWNFVEEIKIVRCDCGCIFRIIRDNQLEYQENLMLCIYSSFEIYQA